MHHFYKKANELSSIAIGAALEVHANKGPGLIESIYSKCMHREMELRLVPVEREVVVPVDYKGVRFEEVLRLDMLVDKCLILEFKTVDTILPVHKAQLLSYMKLMNVPIGLVINFNEIVLKKGIHRLILRGADAGVVDF